MSRFFRKVRHQIKRLLPFNRQVNFIICGTQKGGTTALDAYLREHAEICMADKKEVHYFDRNKNFAKNRVNYAKYHAFFSPKSPHKILGEATPIYMYRKTAIKKIFEYNPKMKIIIILRDPIERAYSHWNMERTKDNEVLTFREAIKREAETSLNITPQQCRVSSYIDRGHYFQQLQRIWAYFPTENVLVLKNEELKQQPQQTLNLITSFLGVAAFENIEDKDVHSRPYVSKIGERERCFLKSIYQDQIKLLEEALSWDCSDWLR